MTLSLRRTGACPRRMPITFFAVRPPTWACWATGACFATVKVWNHPPAAGCSPTSSKRRARYAAAVSAPGEPVIRPARASALRKRMSSSAVMTGGGGGAAGGCGGGVPNWATAAAGDTTVRRQNRSGRAERSMKKGSPSAGQEVGVGREPPRERGQQSGGSIEIVQRDHFVRAVHVAVGDRHQCRRHA